jgi:uncharacterized protein (DUF2384 family)
VKRTSQVVCFGAYSLAGWDIEVLQISDRCIRTWLSYCCSNDLPGHTRHRTLQQIRADCLGAAYLTTLAHEAQFAGVRQRIYSRSITKRLAKNYRIPLHQAATLLELAFAVFGSFGMAFSWLTSQANELGGRLPVRVAASERGGRRVHNVLIRRQLADTAKLAQSNAQVQNLLLKRFVPKFSKTYELFGQIQTVGLSRMAKLHGDSRNVIRSNHENSC